MTIEIIKRKWRMFCLSLHIATLTAAMRCEDGLTDRWKQLCRRRDALLNQRNNLRTAADLRRIERKRGLL